MSGLNKLLKSKLQVAQNKVIRFINQLGTRERITNEILSELNLVNVDTRLKQLKLNHVHKIVNNKCPAYMKENFLNVKDFHIYQTRFSEHNFTIPDCQGPKSHTFYYSAIKDWNSLPEKLKTIQDNKKFKFELKYFCSYIINLRMKMYTCIINRWTRWHLCRDMCIKYNVYEKCI